MKVILLGAPGSGKGTQAAYVSDKYDLPHISTGDLFRENIKNETVLGKKIKSVMSTGRLCPDDLTVELVRDRLANSDCENGYLLDGFPRDIAQAVALDEFAPPDLVIEIKVDLKDIERRITGRRSCASCGASFHIDFIGNTTKCPKCSSELIIRKDDNPATVKERLEVYQTETAPLVDYYKEQGKLVIVNGNQSIENVFNDVVKVLG